MNIFAILTSIISTYLPLYFRHLFFSFIQNFLPSFIVHLTSPSRCCQSLFCQKILFSPTHIAAICCPRKLMHGLSYAKSMIHAPMNHHQSDIDGSWCDFLYDCGANGLLKIWMAPFHRFFPLKQIFDPWAVLNFINTILILCIYLIIDYWLVFT